MGDIYLRFALDLSKIRDIVRIAEFEKKTDSVTEWRRTVLLQNKKIFINTFIKGALSKETIVLFPTSDSLTK